MDKWDSGWPKNVKSETVMPTTSQIKLFTQQVDCVPDECLQDYTRRGGLFVSIINVWCSCSQLMDSVYLMLNL